MSIQCLIFVLLVIGSVCSQHPAVSQFRVTRQWKYFNFTWPDEETYMDALEKQAYIPKNIILKRVKFYDNFYYLSLPRMRYGTPATLARIPEGLQRGTSPTLEPYPSWGMNEEGNCLSLQNVQNIEIDDKGHMWIVDLGYTAVLEDKINRNCSPKLVIHDIKTNWTVTVYNFPEEVIGTSSYLYDLVVDGDYAYITDNSAEEPGIIVYSRSLNEAWRFSHPKSMKADMNAREFRINGVPVSYAINVAPIALGPRLRTKNGRVILAPDRVVYYCPLSSFHLYSVSTDALRNASETNKEVKDLGVKASQTDAMIMDNQGILYYSLLADNSIALWDSRTPFPSGQKMIARDSTYIQWVSSFTFDNRGNLTALTNRMQNYIVYGEFNVSEYNFWLLTAHTGGRSYIYDFNDYQPLPTTSQEYDEVTASSKLDVKQEIVTNEAVNATTEAPIRKLEQNNTEAVISKAVLPIGDNILIASMFFFITYLYSS